MKQRRNLSMQESIPAHEAVHPNLTPLGQIRSLQSMRKALADIDVMVARTILTNAQRELEQMEDEFAKSAQKVKAKRSMERHWRQQELMTRQILLKSFQMERQWLANLTQQKEYIEDGMRRMLDAEEQHLKQLKRRRAVELRLVKLGEVIDNIESW